MVSYSSKPLATTHELAMTTSVILKLSTFALGLALLIGGALYLDYPDWDIGVSLAMAFTALASAEWVASVLWQGRWRWLPLALFWTWLPVDGVYWAYWSIVRPDAMIREGQWQTSLCLYALCGITWYRLVPIMAEMFDRFRRG